jgi:hypothetical protein
VGLELEPPRTILVLTRARFERLASARPVPVALSVELLAATNLVLLPFR